MHIQDYEYYIMLCTAIASALAQYGTKQDGTAIIFADKKLDVWTWRVTRGRSYSYHCKHPRLSLLEYLHEIDRAAEKEIAARLPQPIAEELLEYFSGFVAYDAL